MEFVVIGGCAAVFHHLAESTADLDITPNAEASNTERLLRALDGMNSSLNLVDWVPTQDSPVVRSHTRFGPLDLIYHPPVPWPPFFLTFQELAGSAGLGG